MPDLRPLPPGTLLYAGAHRPSQGRLCVMEAVAYVAGEAHSDRPTCASLVLASYARALNDVSWPSDEERTAALAPIVPLLVGTRDDTPGAHDRHLRLLLLPVVREIVAPLFRKTGLTAHAEAMEALPDNALWRDVARVCHAAANAAAYEAAYAAYAAYDAAYAAAYAVDAYAAYAATRVAVAVAAARPRVLTLAVDMLRRACIAVREAKHA